eukprot:6176344-Pleurochrysis_carterae.AAC.3
MLETAGRDCESCAHQSGCLAVSAETRRGEGLAFGSARKAIFRREWSRFHHTRSRAQMRMFFTWRMRADRQRGTDAVSWILRSKEVGKAGGRVTRGEREEGEGRGREKAGEETWGEREKGRG